MKRLLALAALLLLAALPPPAAADHVYSHRLVLEGRLVGADGLPLAGREVELLVEDQLVEGACGGGPAPNATLTDAWGDFAFCLHAHHANPDARMGARAGNATQWTPVDVELRRMVVTLQDDAEGGTAPEGWARTFRVDGRVWHRGGEPEFEGVPVQGMPVTYVAVNLTIEGPGDAVSWQEVFTNGFGDYVATVQLLPGQDPADVRVYARALRNSLPAVLDPTTHRATVDFRLPLVEAEAVPASPPGTTTPPLGAGLALVMALGVTASVLVTAKERLRFLAEAGEWLRQRARR